MHRRAVVCESSQEERVDEVLGMRRRHGMPEEMEQSASVGQK